MNEETIRVKIRKHGNPSGKLLRFHKSIQLNPLISKIANKLLMGGDEDNNISGCFDASQHQLLLGGEYIVEQVSEINDDDELVLKRRIRNEKPKDGTTEGDTTSPQTSNTATIGSIAPATTTTSVTPVTKQEEDASTTTTSGDDQVVPIKKESPHESGELISLVDDNDDTVIRPDANTSQSNQTVGTGGRAAGIKRKASSTIRRVKKKKPEIITIDDDESDTDDDDSSSDGSIEDGSDAWMTSSEDDEEEEDEEESDFEPDSDNDDSEEETTEVEKPKANKASKNQTKKESPLQVLMEEKDVPSAPGKRDGKNEEEGQEEEEVSLLVNGAGRQKTEKAVKDRIMKLLNTGFHDQSNEHEAKNAMKLAQRLMRKHNLSQALLLKERDEKSNGDQSNNGVLKGGMVHVQIINRKTQKPALFARWLSTLAYHVGTNFDVKSYHTVRRGRKCEVTFYGIYTNAQLAGYAFRVAAERISQMGATYEPERRRSKNISLASCRLSYCIGIVKGIGDEVERTIREEKLKRLRKLERARLAVSQGEAYEESDDEGSNENDNDGPSYSFQDPASQEDETGADDRLPSATDASIQDDKTSSHQSEQAVPLGMNDGGSSAVKPQSVLSGMTLNQRLQELENENQAALTLVDHREKVAEDVLKDNGVKLSSARPRAHMNFDGKSYRQGIEDSKEVDINQRAIRDEVKVKREVKRE